MYAPDFTGPIRDYNGTGPWSVVAVQRRYLAYCTHLQFPTPHPLLPETMQDGEALWIYPIMDKVILGIAASDPACIALGVDYLEQDRSFPFGRRLKANTARALRRAVLTETQQSRLRERIVDMLVAGLVPHEMREYAKLLRTVGVGPLWPRLDHHIPRSNPYAMRFYRSLCAAAGRPHALCG